MDLIDDAPSNTPEYSVSEISGALRRVIEGEFGRVRVRGEVGRVVIARTGHMYFDLKDAQAVLTAVSWKGQVARMQVKPEEGMEVIATGRMTTFGPQSKYQLQVESVEPAGAGALMAMLERRRAQLAAEGLFDPARKRPLPALPRVIGVITSPQGAVIRDILHRLSDRFGVHVLIWPVAVQGQSCAPDVARAIAGFNALAQGGPIPRPDVLIVARGGGSIEDLWGFNEENVVRAAAASAIPLISAVGHETDTTLIDHAADRRAPTPTAAAEMAVPVLADLRATLSSLRARLDRGAAQGVRSRAQRLADLSRALPRPDGLLAPAMQRFDLWAERLPGALTHGLQAKGSALREAGAGLRLAALSSRLDRATQALARAADRLEAAPLMGVERAEGRLQRANARLRPTDLTPRLQNGAARLANATARLDQAQANRLARAQDRVAGLARLHDSLGYRATLARGYAVVRDPSGSVITRAQDASRQRALRIEFADAELEVRPTPPKGRKPDGPDGQGSLL